MTATSPLGRLATMPESPHSGLIGVNAPVIQVRGLTKRYGATTVVSEVTFTVERGDVFGFLGPNGAGKSTVIAMLLGLIAPSAGTVELFGLGHEQRAAALTRVGAIIESPAFYPYLSGRDNLEVLARLRPAVTAQRVAEVLEIVGLTPASSKRYAHYSLGMKQRLGIGWTLLHDPDLLILDEPTNGLDPAGMAEIRHLITHLAAEGKTIFISSHLLHEIELICDRFAIIQQGRTVASGTVADLTQRGARLLIRVDEPTRATAVLRSIAGVGAIEQRDDGLLVAAPQVRPAVVNRALVEAGIAVDELRDAGNSLEHAFLELTSIAPN
jgi:ABC-2 type transport system ATP-binding protein